MKAIIGVIRIFVGILFIISGLIKLNDPVGFSFKLGDYFAPDVLNLEFLVPYALLIAIVVVVYEVLLGVMLIIGYARKFTLWSLLIMIIGFTFLTFYSAYFNKVTDCGCFGDALPLVPWESFIKDVVLLVLIIILFIGRKHIWPFFTKMTRSLIMFVTFIACLGFGYHVLMHLPAIDFRAYKIGNNIQEGMSVPDDAPAPLIQYNWEYEVDGKSKVISNTTGQDPAPAGGTRVGVTTAFLQEPYEPPIHDFSMERNGEDYAATLLEEENLIVVIAYNLDVAEMNGFPVIREVTNEAIKNGYKVIGMSASSQEATEKLVADYNLNFDFYFCDMTTLKTIVRSNPGILELQKGTITQKLHFNDAKELQLKQLPGAPLGMDFTMKARLDSIAALDQKYRKLLQVKDPESRKALGKEMGFEGMEFEEGIWQLQNAVDSSNMAYVAQVFKSSGYPGTDKVGRESNMAAWFVLQHNPDRIGEFLPMVKEAAKNDQLPFTAVAMMEDRHLMMNNKPQVYGTQGTTRENVGQIIWPIDDPENVNARRMEAGYTTTVEDYAKQLYGSDFSYRVVTMDEINEN